MKINDFVLKNMILGWKMIFVVKKHVFMMILATKIENLKKWRILFRIDIFFQNFIFDQEFDSNGPGA